MPEFNLIQRPDLIMRLQQFLGLRQAHITPTVAEQVQAVVILGDVRESGQSRGQVRQAAQAFGLPAGGAGTLPSVQLTNRAGSGVLVTTRHVHLFGISAAVAYTFEGSMAFGAAELPIVAANGPYFRDAALRDSGATPAARVTGDNVDLIAVTPLNFIIRHEIGGMALMEQSHTLLPGWSLRIQIPTTLTAFNSWFAWEEVDLQPR